MGQQIGEVAGEQLDRVWACRLVRFTVAAAVIDQDRRVAGNPNPRSMANEWMRTTPFVPCPRTA